MIRKILILFALISISAVSMSGQSDSRRNRNRRAVQEHISLFSPDYQLVIDSSDAEIEIDGNPFPENIPSVIPEISKAWRREIVKKLLEATDIADANYKLARMKTEYKVKKYGPFAECRNPDNSWLVIFDSTGQIKALLGPKTEARPDYLTRTYKSISDYSGMYALWFVFAK